MKYTDFVKTVERTVSGGSIDASNKTCYLDKLNRVKVDQTFQNTIDALKELDKLKKAAFYGTPQLIEAFNEGTEGQETFDSINFDVIPATFIHGMIGLATEVGEVIEETYAAIKDNRGVDYINIQEELGDISWYFPLIITHLPTVNNPEELYDLVNKKLEARYPEKFTQTAAVVRDLDKERAILEEGIKKEIEEDIEERTAFLTNTAEKSVIKRVLSKLFGIKYFKR